MNVEKFDYSIDIEKVILWQYDEARVLLSLLNKKQAWLTLNHTDFWKNWFDQVFNLSAENTEMSLFGLSVWSFILNVPLFASNPNPPVLPVEWGFNAFDPVFPDYINDNLNFNNAPFSPLNPVISLTQPQQHFVLLLKYFNCTTRGSIQSFIAANYKSSTLTTPPAVYKEGFLYSINEYLQYLLFWLGDSIGYGTNQIFCYDNLNMTITYHFTDLSAFPTNLLQALKVLDLLPRPAGVLRNIQQLPSNQFLLSDLSFFLLSDGTDLLLSE